MMDAFASIISNNLNAVMKILTSLTLMLSLPTIIAAFYGMNVKGLPLAERPFAFIFILVLSILISLSAGYVFYKRDWL
jgi:magnesium transporter